MAPCQGGTRFSKQFLLFEICGFKDGKIELQVVPYRWDTLYMVCHNMRNPVLRTEVQYYVVEWCSVSSNRPLRTAPTN